MRILFASLCFCFLSCSNEPQKNNSGQNKPAPDTTITSEQHPDKNNWNDEFLSLRKAIISGDRETVKKFFDFPIKSEENEIWFLADMRQFAEMNPHEIKPFTEGDFDQYFSSIFSMDLRMTLEQLKTEEFFARDVAYSPEIEVVPDSKSQLDASFDKATKIITLKLTTILSTPSESTTAQKFIMTYEFDVTPDQKIKFRKVHFVA